jgi:nucleotide-binding universal stress UspA family protein
MSRWKRILVPTDFSPCADAAVDLAVDLARGSGAMIVLQHATERPSGLGATAMIVPEPGRAPVAVDEWMHAKVRARLEHAAAPLRALGLEVRVRSDVGKAHTAVLAAIEAEGADLCVIGTHGRAGVAHFLLGSVAEKVVRHANIPVLTVRGHCATTAGVDDDPIEHQLDAETQG